MLGELRIKNLELRIKVENLFCKFSFSFKINEILPKQNPP